MRWQGPWLAVCAVIFYLSSQPSPPTELPFEHFDKLIHFLIYFALGLLVTQGFEKMNWPLSQSAKFYWIFALLFCFLYGASDEWHQYFVPTRTMDFWDWCADAVGAGLAGFVYSLYRRMKPKSL